MNPLELAHQFINLFLGRLRQTFETLSVDAQRGFLEKELLEILSEEDCEKLSAKLNQVVPGATAITGTTSKKQPVFTPTPSLQFRTKRSEISQLLRSLRYPSPPSGSSYKRELLDEVISSLTSWFEVIWQVVYECKAEFEEAHRCLLYAWGTLAEIKELDLDFGTIDRRGGSGCRCAIMAYPLVFTIKDRKGKVIKHFSGKTLCVRTAERVLFWLWRELFVSLAAYRSKSGHDLAKKQVAEMMLDVEEAMGGPRALERILHGGAGDKAFNPWDYDPEDDNDDEWEDESDYNGDYDMDSEDEKYISENDSERRSDTEDDEIEDDDHFADPACDCTLHASHWSSKINNQRLFLRDIILERLNELFAISPSTELHDIILSMTPDFPEKTERDLLEVLSRISCSSSSNFAASLEIYSTMKDTEKIVDLLDTHSHLLRSSDAKAYQQATKALVTPPASTITSAFPNIASLFPTLNSNSSSNKSQRDPVYKQRLALKIVETQLGELVHTMRLGIRSCFDKIEEPAKVDELNVIIRLPANSARRGERIGEWVDSVETSTRGGQLDPMAFAAFMMGLGGAPFGVGGMGAEEDGAADMIGLLEQLEGHAGDEEYVYSERARVAAPPQTDGGGKPVAAAALGGQLVLQKLYVKMAEEMPWLKAKDVVEEMVSRLRDRPAKAHVSAALETLSSFAKLQRSNIALRAEKKKRSEQKRKKEQQEKEEKERLSLELISCFGPTAVPATSGPPPVSITARSGHRFSFGDPTALNAGSTGSSGAQPSPIRTVGGLDDVD
ncbi:hypothetical protein AAF712_007561 [Marasmius tenuissimus]|uniref:Uncharacterized protein n=1 Tax=Marasmius tenuissimus TaxID=585030 RepID=A0ABR2ZWS0_9AGAR